MERIFVNGLTIYIMSIEYATHIGIYSSLPGHYRVQELFHQLELAKSLPSYNTLEWVFQSSSSPTDLRHHVWIVQLLVRLRRRCLCRIYRGNSVLAHHHYDGTLVSRWK